MCIAAARYNLLLFLGFEIVWAIPKLSLACEDNSCVGLQTDCSPKSAGGPADVDLE